MADVEAVDVDNLIGRNVDVAKVIPIVTTMAKAYTRGRGFEGNEPNDEIAAVVMTAAARLAANGQQAQVRNKVGNVEREHRSFFDGWTLAEQLVLNRYRVRAM